MKAKGNNMKAIGYTDTEGDTDTERRLMNVINNFIEWDTNKEDYKKAQKYIRYVSKEKFPRYNHWFRVTKDDVIKFIENNVNEEEKIC